MFDIGGGELLLIAVVVLLLFGPKKIPEAMAAFGKGLRQFRQAQENIKQQLRDISAEVEQSTVKSGDTAVTPRWSANNAEASKDDSQDIVDLPEQAVLPTENQELHLGITPADGAVPRASNSDAATAEITAPDQHDSENSKP